MDQEVVNSLSTHLGNELIRIAVIEVVVLRRYLIVDNLIILLLRQQVIHFRA